MRCSSMLALVVTTADVPASDTLTVIGNAPLWVYVCDPFTSYPVLVVVIVPADVDPSPHLMAAMKPLAGSVLFPCVNVATVTFSSGENSTPVTGVPVALIGGSVTADRLVAWLCTP